MKKIFKKNRQKRYLQIQNKLNNFIISTTALCLFVTLMLFTSSSIARPISAKEAKQCAQNWMYLHGVKNLTSLNVFSSGKKTDSNIKWQPHNDFYIVNFEPKGFVVVAQDDVAYPILFYSYDKKYTGENLPPQFIEMMKIFANDIHAAVSNQLNPYEHTVQQWKTLKSENISQLLQPTDYNDNDVSPLISATWSQGTYYNNYCPSDSAGPDGHVVVGCVAVAMAQIMNYHQHPAQGTGSHSYNHSTYGTLSANFGATTYNWSSMPNSLSGYNNDVAQLLYHCGVSVEMDYGPSGSGASSSDVPDALKQYFGYASSASYVARSSYSESAWTALLRTELDAGRPLYYRSPGHAFNCDGYQGTDHFHFNWGWGGTYNGYYYLNDLTPGSHDYNNNQYSIIGITPAGGGSSLEILKLKGKVDWKKNPGYGNDTILCKAPSTLPDLKFLDGCGNNSQFLIFDGGSGTKVSGSSGSFKSKNKKCTSVNLQYKSATSKYRVKTKVKLKNGYIYVLRKMKNGNGSGTKFNVTNADSGGWQPRTMNVEMDLSNGGTSVQGDGTIQVQYKTKANKSTKVK